MPHTFTDGNLVYSVDLMLAYINIFKPAPDTVDMSSINFNISRICWSNRTVAPIDVIKNPQRYKDEYKRIMDAELKYPIIVDADLNIIDGVHRYVKSLMLRKKTIKVYRLT